MAAPNALRALGPCWFRFTDPEDVGKYGDGWFRYAESEVLRLRAQDLIALETDLGMPIVAVMNGFRDSTVLGDTAVAWMGVRATDPARAGDFDAFNPITMLIEWSHAEPTPGPKDEEPESTLVQVGPPLTTPSDSESTISAPTDTVVLPNLPIAESRP